MPAQDITLIAGVVLLAALPTIVLIVAFISEAHSRDLTTGAFCRCLACNLAATLVDALTPRRHRRGRHRMRNLYAHQRHIRADFAELTRDS